MPEIFAQFVDATRLNFVIEIERNDTLMSNFSVQS